MSRLLLRCITTLPPSDSSVSLLHLHCPPSPTPQEEHAEECFRRVLDFRQLAKHQTRHHKFGFYFATDGVHVSLLMTRPAKAKPPSPPPAGGSSTTSSPPSSSASAPSGKAAGKKDTRPPPQPPPHFLRDRDSYKRIVGVDPGQRDVYVAVDQDDGLPVPGRQGRNGRPPVPHRSTAKCSGPNYYHAAGFTKRTRKRNRRLAREPELRAFQSGIPSPKTAREAHFVTRVTYVTEHLGEIRDFYHRRIWRRERWHCGMRKQSFLHEMCRRIAWGMPKEGEGWVPFRKEEVLVGYGDASVGSKGCIRRKYQGPQRELKALLREYADVVMISEFRTSQYCADCVQNGVENQPKLRALRGPHIKSPYALKVCNHCDKVRGELGGRVPREREGAGW